jgi:multidrug resistance efflux pump
MKNISFKRKESAIRGLENQKVAKTKAPRNWDRLIYFFVLFLLLFFLIKYLINSFFYIHADGQVLFDNIEIRNTSDCRIVEYYVKEGDEVCLGDSLFSFLPDKPAGSFNNFGTYEFALNQQKKSDISWSEKETFQVKEDMKLNLFLIAEKNKMKALLEKDLERIKNEVMLDVLPRNRLDDQYGKINQINFEIQTLKGKNTLLNQSLAELSKLKRDLSDNASANAGGNGDGNGESFHDGRLIFYSPLEGTVTDIMKNEFEVALKDEQILSIHKPQNVYIKGFFKQEDLKSLIIDEHVIIKFPDGTDGDGIIKRFYFTTYRLPEEFQKKYEPTTRSLSVDILPASDEDLKKWRMFWKMGVKIIKPKY